MALGIRQFKKPHMYQGLKIPVEPRPQVAPQPYRGSTPSFMSMILSDSWPWSFMEVDEIE